MTADACATPGCGHAKNEHWDGRLQCFDGLIGHCKSYLPPRPVPEVRLADRPTGPVCGHSWHMSDIVEWTCEFPPGHEGLHGSDLWIGHPMRWTDDGQYVEPTPATVPAPHAEAEAAWEEFFRLHHNSLRLTVEELRREAFIAGYLRGRGDRG